jgi:NAD+ synthase
LKDRIIEFIRKAVLDNNYKGAVIGISGGIDSALVGKLAVESLGKDRVFGLLLPERDSSPETLADSKLVVSYLGIEYKIQKLTGALRGIGTYRLQPPALFIPSGIKEKYVRSKWNALSEDPFLDDLRNRGNEEFSKGLAYYRSKHRMRLVALYLEGEKRNYAVLGTTNRTEKLCGFYVKWGDDSTDIEPIMHLYKTEVYELSRKLGIPEKIIDKAPTPDLVPGITDEFSLRMKYRELDEILERLDTGKEIDPLDDKTQRVLKILEAAKFRDLRNLSIDRI